MKKNCIKIIFFFVITICISNNYGQDVHFSQFWQSQTFTNPAHTGFFEGQGRFELQHRNQWQSISKPYSTFMFSADMPAIKRKYQQDLFGIGLNLFHDVAGDSRLRTTKLNLSFSYIKGLNKKNNSNLSFGILIGGARRSINYSDLTFDEQFYSGQFNQNANITEVFEKENYYYGDCGLGVAYMYSPKKSLIFNFGLSTFHLNTPNQSFYENKISKLKIKTIFTTNIIYKYNDLVFIPQLMTSFQGEYKEILLGIMAKYVFLTNSNSHKTFNVGIFMRGGDAAYLTVGTDYNNLQIGFSYDINLSKLHIASHYMGAWEISLSYIIKNSTYKKLNDVPCPVF